MPTAAARPQRAPSTPKSAAPAYRRLKRANGKHLAFVDLDGRRVYLGAWGSPESKQAHQRLLVERRRGIAAPSDGEDLLVVELLAAFTDHARVYYREPDGSPGREVANFAPLIRLLRDLYGDQPTSSFDARALKNVRQAMIDKGYARRTINRMVVRARSIFKWGVSEGLVPPLVLTSLSALDGLRAGRSAAKESPPVLPVTDAQIEATMPFLPQVVQDMIRVQLYTGMRPGELCQMRAMDIEVAGELWVYRPRSHKTQHRGRERLIAIGPRAQEILQHYRVADPVSETSDGWCSRSLRQQAASVLCGCSVAESSEDPVLPMIAPDDH